jgi:endonuclease/exonuclease/phosphatase family metal-dependent hydrolase
MADVRIITWNVLHRIHGEKWSKHVIRHFPDESVRIGRIAQRVAGWLAEGPTVVCLQEVSGDQLAALRAPAVLSHRYARVPKWWRFWSRPLADASEHLAIVTGGATLAAHKSFDDDDGKGLLAVDAGGVRIVTAHLTFGRAGEAQLGQLGALATERTVLAGDFNADREAVARVLGARFALAQQDGTTRAEGAKQRRGHSVDFIAVAGGQLDAVRLFDSEGLSDHHALGATLRF